MGKPEGRRILGGQRLRWEDNNKLDFQDVGFGVIDWIEQVQDMNSWLAGTCECVNVLRVA